MLTNNSQNNSVRTFSAIRVDKSSNKSINEKQINFNFPKTNNYATLLNNVKQMVASTSNNNTSNVSVIDLGKMLLQSARDGELAKVHELISRGAPFSADWLGMTPLHFAAMNNHPKICEVLIRGGINRDAKTKVDRTPLHLAVYEGHKTVVELLIFKNCELNGRDMLKMTPLHWAIEKSFKAIAKMLLANGAEVNVISKFGKTPISLAIQTGQTDLLDELHQCQENWKQNEILRNEQNEKSVESKNETNQAVNSITFCNNAILDSELYQLCDHDDSTDKPSINRKVKIKKEPNIENQNTNDPSTLEMLKDLKSLIPPDDTENDDLLASALQNGRKLVLSEGGRLALNEAKIRQVTENLNGTNNFISNKRKISLTENDHDNKKLYTDGGGARLLKSSMGIPLKSGGKNIKIISMDMFKKLFGKDAAKTIKKDNTNLITKTSSPLHPQIHSTTNFTKLSKVTNLNEINARKAIFSRQTANPPIIPSNKIQTTSSSTAQLKSPEIIETNNQETKQTNYDDNDELPPNIIEVFTDDESNNDIIENDEFEESNVQSKTISPPATSSSSLSSQPPPLTIKKPIICYQQRIKPVVPLLDIPEICLQLYDLQKQNEELKNELNFTRQENEDYRIRLERLENNFDSLANL